MDKMAQQKWGIYQVIDIQRPIILTVPGNTPEFVGQFHGAMVAHAKILYPPNLQSWAFPCLILYPFIFLLIVYPFQMQVPVITGASH